MGVGDALLTFVSVFVAAALAFYLDGLREKRATAAWVREYLGFWRRFLADSSGDRQTNEQGLARIRAALDAWLAEGDEPVWSDLQALNVNSAVGFTSLLLSAGAGVVPPDLLSKMFIADATAAMVIRRSEGVTRLFETQVQSLVLSRGRPVPTRAACRRAVPRRVRSSGRPGDRLHGRARRDPGRTRSAGRLTGGRQAPPDARDRGRRWVG